MKVCFFPRHIYLLVPFIEVVSMNFLWLFTLAYTIVPLVHSAPDWGPLPYEYFQELYDHYGEGMQHHIEHVKHVHEAHHENQHRVHENYQESFYDINERHQERSESDQEAYERSQEDLRSADSNKKSLLPTRVNPQIGEKEAKSFLRRITILR